MRLFALLMLLLNIGYFAWTLASGRGGTAADLVRSPAREAPERLVLLDESVGAAAAADAPGDLLCLDVGAFASAAEGERFVEGARALGLRAAARPLEVTTRPDHWVHMPPFVSEAAAQRRLEELKGKGIDSYLIAGGELDRGISLGLFSRRESALRLQEELAAQGYPSEIHEVPRSYTEFWVEVGEVPADGESQLRWAEFMALWPGLGQAEKLCETIAPPSQFP